jgi:uncharacterized protein YdhG (YjbR/CyaY superfamily)
MPRPKRSFESEVTIDGVKLAWRLHREQQWCTADGWKGISIQVRAKDGAHRELILEYPVVSTLKDGWSRVDLIQPQIRAAKVEDHIREAMAAGWDPNSRGKAFAFQVNEMPGQISTSSQELDRPGTGGLRSLMVRADAKSVDEYVAAQPEAVEDALRRVRSAIRKAVPKANESISYGVPTYKLRGERLLYFAGWKKHYSLYPATKTMLAAFKDDLGNAKAVKSTLQFSFTEPVPVKLIERIARFRAKEVAEKKN